VSRARLAPVAVIALLACQPTHGFRFKNPSPTRRIVNLLEARGPDTLGAEGNAACAKMQPLRTPLGVVDTVEVLPDSNFTVMIALGSDFADNDRFCFISTAPGSHRADTLYLRGDSAYVYTRGGVVTLQLSPALELIRPRR